MKQAIESRDFQKLAEITIKDSNNFHAICQDTYPPINYLNDTSNFIIKCVEVINRTCFENIVTKYGLINSVLIHLMLVLIASL
jgi:diphosphomevalonate decarboxylase